MNDSNFDPALNSWDCDGIVKYYNGVNQTKRKQEFIIEKIVVEQCTLIWGMINLSVIIRV